MLAASPHTLTQMLVDADGSMRAYSYTNVLRPIVVLEAADLLQRFGNFVKDTVDSGFFANPSKYLELQQFCQVRRPRPVGGAVCRVARLRMLLSCLVAATGGEATYLPCVYVRAYMYVRTPHAVCM